MLNCHNLMVHFITLIGSQCLKWLSVVTMYHANQFCGCFFIVQQNCNDINRFTSNFCRVCLIFFTAFSLLQMPRILMPPRQKSPTPTMNTDCSVGTYTNESYSVVCSCRQDMEGRLPTCTPDRVQLMARLDLAFSTVRPMVHEMETVLPSYKATVAFSL